MSSMVYFRSTRRHPAVVMLHATYPSRRAATWHVVLCADENDGYSETNSSPRTRLISWIIMKKKQNRMGNENDNNKPENS